MGIINHIPPESDLPKIGKPTNRALHMAGFYRLEQFTEVTESDILKIHGVGPKVVRILNDALKEKGLSFSNKP